VIEHDAESARPSDSGNEAAKKKETDQLLSSEQEQEIVWDDNPIPLKPIIPTRPEVSNTTEAELTETKTAPLAAAPSTVSAKRSALDRLTFDERLALFV
jgi:hypothetical protein